MQRTSEANGGPSPGVGSSAGPLSVDEIFPYDEPYDDQADAIRGSEHTIREDGFVAFEGPCGTGKTLAAMTVAMKAIRDSSTKYQRAFVLTSVHQQLRAFEDDIEAINANLPDGVDPLDALTLVGKTHLCPYTQADSPPIESEDIYRECDNLREPVRNLISNGGNVNAVRGQLRQMLNVAEATTDQSAQPLSSGAESDEDGWTAAYKDSIPAPDEGEFCPFYAKYRDEFAGTDGYEPTGVMRPWDLLAKGAEEGMCPHAMSISALENVEVLIGNYQHVFHPLTVTAMTGAVIDDSTLLIVDEAHGLVENVRSELSDELALGTIAGAVDELKNIRESDNAIKQKLNDDIVSAVGEDEFEEVVEFLTALNERLEEKIVNMLDEEDTDWHNRSHTDLPDEIRENLRDPEEPAEDNISTWISLAGWSQAFSTVEEVGEALDAAYDRVEEEDHYIVDDSQAVTVGHLLGRWRECDHETYFRQFYLDKRAVEYSNKSGYEAHYTAKLHLRNCIPKAEIADRLAEFGGGILQSATLSPMDVYTETVGLNELEADGRAVKTLSYGLRYPEENRESVAVDVPKFTRGNRGGDPWHATGEQQTVRKQYRDVARATVTTTDGNVLICLPNYEEARWIADRLNSHPAVEKPVRADGSDVDSERLRRWFINGEPKVLCTGLRGTLTEGVDYDGDALKACVVIGLPIRSLAGDYPDAIQAAYKSAFGKANSFEYAFTLGAVHKTRQSLGRVIRGEDECGVRVLADRRYASMHQWDDVREFLPEYERADYDPIEPSDLEQRLTAFWNSMED